MCSAIFLRIVDIGSTRVFAASARGIGGGACGALLSPLRSRSGGGRGGGAAWLTVRAPCDAM